MKKIALTLILLSVAAFAQQKGTLIGGKVVDKCP